MEPLGAPPIVADLTTIGSSFEQGVGLTTVTAGANVAMSALGAFLDPIAWVVGQIMEPIYNWIIANIAPVRDTLNALLGNPEVMILDEPTVGLDPVLRADLWAIFRGLAADGATLLISSHVMDEATRCDRLLLMREGRFIADDSPSGLLLATGTETTEDAFLTLIASDRAPSTATPQARGRHLGASTHPRRAGQP